MKFFKRTASLIAGTALTVSLCACGSGSTTENSQTGSSQSSQTSYDVTNPDDMSALSFDNKAWKYDSDNDVYWQIGVQYCASPSAKDYESLGIYVPGAYMNAEDNGDGTYTCTVNNDNKVGNYTANTAPIVMPVNTAGYSAQPAPSSYSYSGLSDYMDSGFIYVYAGCRGRDNGTNSDGTSYAGGAPWGVTDLKSAVRYLRYNESSLPGNTDSIFTFGHSGGGAQSSLMGSTGDSELYFSYLESIGAAMLDNNGNYISDSVAGAMCWCPITSLDYADEAYEWMMGQYSSTGTRADDTWTSALSDDMSEAFASYINSLGLTDENGTVLTLSQSDSGIYTSGSYYDYVKSTIETSLNNFLSDTTFPYTSGGSKEMADGGFAGGGMDSTKGMPDNSQGGIPSGDLPSGEVPSGEKLPSDNAKGEKHGGMKGGFGNAEESKTYETVQDYIDSLNSDGKWITYDSSSNTASITSVEDFVKHCKTASKNVGAFDDLDRSQAENKVFGNNENNALHFDSVMSRLLSDNKDKYSEFNDYNSSYADEYAKDMNSTDALGTSSAIRQNMYNPMYFLSSYYDGYGTSTVAKYWRINTGINQGDTSLTTEMNLALALQSYDGVKDVDFTTVWGEGHTPAERTGSSNTNFIEWVNTCLSSK